MFEFFKEFDEEIYNEIINEVEFNMWNDRCISIIQSEIEKIIKKIFKDSNIIITNMGNDGIIYREYNPSLSRLFNEEEFKQYLVNNNILTFSDISDYWKILNIRNDKEHGHKANKEKIEITLQIKRDSLKHLFKLCCNAYKYKFNKGPKTYWDDEYFEKLLRKPEEKIVEVERVVEKIVEKKIKAIDSAEFQKIKTEHEKLKSQFEIIKNSQNLSPHNLDLVKKLEIGYKCLENKDFNNARIAFKNCKNIDISCAEAYKGLILSSYRCSKLEDIDIGYYTFNNLHDNDFYKDMCKFCSSESVESFNKEIEHGLIVAKEKLEERLCSLKIELDYQNDKAKFIYSSWLCWREEKHVSDSIRQIDDGIKNKITKIYFVAKESTNKRELDYNLRYNVFFSLEKFKNIKEIYFDKNCNYFELIGLSKLEKIFIDPEMIGEISLYIKRCSELKDLIIPEGIEQINKLWVTECRSLKIVSLPTKCTFKGFGTFTFDDCESLTFLDLPSNIEELPRFKNCKSLKEIKIPSHIKSIGMDTFCGCKSLLYIKIPSSVKEILRGAFAHCESLKNIVLPQSITHIEENTFYGCSKLETINLPKNIKVIEKSAFACCESLKNISFPNSLEHIGKSAFSGCINLELIIFPEKITSIDDYAFSDCDMLKSVLFPKNTKDILYNGVFSNCSNLQEIEIPEGERYIGANLFENCINLKTIKLPDSIEGIMNDAFKNCKNLININYPKSLTQIYPHAFDGCSKQIKKIFQIIKK